jgi:hypothetical protein
VAPLKGPTLFNCAEDGACQALLGTHCAPGLTHALHADFIFGAALREACKKTLADRADAPVHEFILYDK